MIVAGNWKMNKTPEEAKQFVASLLEQATATELREIILLPPALCLSAVREAAKGAKLSFGAQNCHFAKSGAFTGENSAAVLAHMGAEYCLVGHSERRQLFGETNEFLAKKVVAVEETGMVPILCIGETLQEREAGKTKSVLESQLREGLNSLMMEDEVLEMGEKDDLGMDPLTGVWIAYEPVWAIGTGRVAGPDQVREAHGWIHSWLAENGFVESTPILYGGSVKPENAAELAKLPHVDGFLVGGASLELKSLLGILRSK